MVNRDKAGSFTIEQLKQQYNLDNKDITKMVEQQNGTLQKIENEVNNAISSIIINLGELLESQSDISLWFFSGIPTLENNPYIEWQNPSEHEGDLYYNRETGVVYKYLNNSWIEQHDEDLNMAMALTNTETDIDDNERKVFFQTPTTPYTSGDWWIKEDGSLYICQIGKQTGEYEENDFVIFNKYQNTKAIKDSNKLTVLTGRITTVETGIDEVRTEMEENKYYEDSEGNRQLISSSMSEVEQNLGDVEVSIEELKTNLEDNYTTTEDVEQLIINSQEGITNTLSHSGGTNLIRNSALLFEENNGYEYWTGSLLRGNADVYGVTSETRTVILTQSSNANQQIVLTPNDYTLAFKYKRLSPISTITFKINGEEQELAESEGSFEKTIHLDSTNITIDFLSSVDNGYAIYDLMLNKGNVASSYTQHANETTTDTVRIGKGISVESNSTDTTTKVDSDGFRVTSKGNQSDILLRATDTGTFTKTLEVLIWASIVNLYFQEVDGQTWITGL